jgi:hypothetical protein
MQTFPKGLNSPKIKSFLSGFTCEEIRSESPETRDQIFNQILIEEANKGKIEKKKLGKPFLQRVKNFLLDLVKVEK